MNSITKEAEEKKEALYEQKRESMRFSIESAIVRLRNAGIRVTKKSIADEIGCHENTLKQPYIKEFLSSFDEFQPHSKEAPPMTLEQALLRITKLENALTHSKNRNQLLIAEQTRLRIERDEYENKYRHLLGEYQIKVGKKKVGY